MRLDDGVYLVGGGVFTGFGLSPGLDSHVYLIHSDGESALVDCGMGTHESMAALVANIVDEGLDPDAIRAVFVTHYHADHAGGAAAWRRRAGARISASTAAVRAMEAGDEEATGMALQKAVGLLPSDLRVEPCPVDDPLSDGDVRRVGSATVTAIHSPGHSAADVCYLVRLGEKRYLFTGDTMFYLGLVRFQNNADFDFLQLRASLLRLADIEADALLPGHGALCLAGARAHLSAAGRSVAGTGVPRELPRPPHPLHRS